MKFPGQKGVRPKKQTGRSFFLEEPAEIASRSPCDFAFEPCFWQPARVKTRVIWASCLRELSLSNKSEALVLSLKEIQPRVSSRKKQARQCPPRQEQLLGFQDPMHTLRSVASYFRSPWGTFRSPKALERPREASSQTEAHGLCWPLPICCQLAG